jgi:hypothetical protein
MRILFVSNNCCMRTQQTMMAAKRAGHEVHAVVALEAVAREFLREAKSVSVWYPGDLSPIATVIKQLQPDIIQVHDRPHSLASAVVEEGLGIPVVCDPHDVEGFLGPITDHSEVRAILGADGLVWPSATYQEIMTRLYGSDKPSVVVPSAVCTHLFPKERLPRRRNTAVWEGGMPIEAFDTDHPRRYIDQRQIVHAFKAAGLSCDMYILPINTRVSYVYETLGAHVRITHPFCELLRQMTAYDFGWHGQFPHNHRQTHSAMPNKMFEYIAAGIPVVEINAKEAGAFVEANNLGISIKEPGEIAKPENRKRLEGIRETLWERRWEFTREAATEPLWELCESLINPPKAAKKEKPDAQPVAV